MADAASSSVGRLVLLAAAGRARPRWLRLIAVTSLVLLAALTRFAIFGPEPGRPYLTFYPAILLAVAVFGRASGLYATALSSVIALWLFVDPAQQLAVSDYREVAYLAYFVFSSLLAISLLDTLYTALQEAAEHRKRADQTATGCETLLEEIIHRSRNDSQRLLALIRLQAASPVTRTQGAAEALDEVAERVAAIGRVNQYLETYWRTNAIVDMGEFLDGLVASLRSGIAALHPIALHVKAEAISLPIRRAVPVGLIVNELVTNALKYAFPDRGEGSVWVGLRREGDDVVLTVEDGGVGCDPSAPPKGTGTGSRLVRALAAQLGGRAVQGAGGGADSNSPGTGWVIRFPFLGP
ncbi:sensor histidine kinase [Sabulicella glaciei]|uniref:histidine kinase n=1 Tax=Sabulicella glaciei TaxID=2984948 RepID=A0ABT3P277_9PROT|nr:DUF4118 domain-containing protein [Roseococcus sp. MDT2-1-1]MCW8088515.1 DUF4118 domain-containing protein [Roseococcus sp. MDT2-1-1]